MKIFAQAGAAIAAALLAAGAAAPAQASDNVAKQSAKKEAQKEPRICVRADMTGTRVVRTICRTAAEWERSGGLVND